MQSGYPTVPHYPPLPHSPNLSLDELKHQLLRNNSPSGIDRDFHAANLLVNILHELDDEVYELMFPHFLQM